MAEVVRPAILPSAQDLVHRHMADGDLCAIVTATNQFVTAPIARAFGIPHMIATIAHMRDWRYTGRSQGTPSFQAGKINRVNDRLAGMVLTPADFTRVYF